jgi:ketosteroid isomerase-like protein
LIVAAGCQHKHHHEHGNTSAAASGDAKQAVINVMEQHRQGLLNKDTATLDRIWASDFVFIDPNGKLLTKAQRLSNVKTGATNFKSLALTEQQVRLLGSDAAVIIGRVELEGQYSGEPGTGSYRYTAALARSGNTWLISVIEMTAIAK